MLAPIKRIFFPSQFLANQELEAMCKTGKVLEEDERGIKVVQLASGEMLKIFRTRNRWSGARIYSHARRFCRNADRLKSLNIPTVNIVALFRLETKGHAAVLYQPLLGDSMRSMFKENLNEVQQLANAFGVFLHTLHAKGIHFHSLHTGNVIVLPNQTFGLIDISDMSIYPWPLHANTRLRSFKRIYKYKSDVEILGDDYWHEVFEAYFNASKSSATFRKKLLSFWQQ